MPTSNLGLIGAGGAAGGINALKDILQRRALEAYQQEQLANQRRTQALAEARNEEDRRQFDIQTGQRNQTFDLERKRFEFETTPKPDEGTWRSDLLGPNGEPIAGLINRKGEFMGQTTALWKAPVTPPTKTWEQEYRELLKTDPVAAQKALEAHAKWAKSDDPAQRGWAPLIVPTQFGSQPGYGVTTPDRRGIVPLPNEPGQSGAAPLPPTATQRDRGAQNKGVGVFLDSVNELSERINTGQGIYAKAAGEASKQAAKLNLDDDVAEYEAMVKSFVPMWARALGHTGVLTQLDVDSAREALPQPGDSKTLRDRKLARIQKIMGALPGGETITGGGSADTGGGDAVDARAWLASRPKPAPPKKKGGR